MKKLADVLLLVVFFSFVIILSSCEKCEFKGISTSELPVGVEGQTYSARIQLDHTCDTKYEYFSLVGGTLPGGVGLSDEGWIEGTPSHEGEYTFTVKVEICFTDEGSDYGDCHERTKGFYIQVNPAP